MSTKLASVNNYYFAFPKKITKKMLLLCVVLGIICSETLFL